MSGSNRTLRTRIKDVQFNQQQGAFFDVLLTVQHLSIILAINQLDAQNLLL